MNRATSLSKIAKPKSYDVPPLPLPLAIADTRNRYGSAADFMLTFNKNIQPKTALHPEKAYLGAAPSLNIIRQAYSYEVLTVWIIAQLEDVNGFVGVREKMTLAQMEYTAHIVATEYGYLKASELHLFLHRLKAGRYGVFYGCIDPIKITQALVQFAEQRRIEISRIEQQLKQTKLMDERAQWAATAVTRQQYELLKNKQI